MGVGCGHQKLLVVGDFLPSAAESMLDNGGCIAALVVLIVLVVSVVAILLVVVAVAIVVPIVAMGVVGIVGIQSFWIVRVTTFGI